MRILIVAMLFLAGCTAPTDTIEPQSIDGPCADGCHLVTVTVDAGEYADRLDWATLEGEAKWGSSQGAETPDPSDDPGQVDGTANGQTLTFEVPSKQNVIFTARAQLADDAACHRLGYIAGATVDGDAQFSVEMTAGSCGD